MPLAADTASYSLPPIHSTADIPPEFNPEQSCAFSLAVKVRKWMGVWYLRSAAGCVGWIG